MHAGVPNASVQHIGLKDGQQKVPHEIVPEGQATQAPLEQYWLDEQQVVPQGVSPEGQPKTQVPLEQVWPVEQQVVPQHVSPEEQHAAPPHGVVPAEQVMHEPSEQIVPTGQQVLARLPTVAQKLCPGAQVQEPFTQD